MKEFIAIIFAGFICTAAINPVFAQGEKKGNAVAKPFESSPSAATLSSFIIEASGMADSKANPGFLWVHEDSGNPPQLFLLSHDGKTVKKIYIKNALNRDWEDMTLANGPAEGKNYIYIGETGDNNAVHKTVSFYRFEEPLAETDTIVHYDEIRFSYEDGPRDAEAFLVDNHTRDIYIITKRESKSRVYKLAYPYSVNDTNKALFTCELPYNGVTGAAISEDGKEILVKTYTSIFYYKRATAESIPDALMQKSISLNYQVEPQGEAVCFAADNSGFYTLSEKRMSLSQKLYFYKRK